jgi:hypothetical protein
MATGNNPENVKHVACEICLKEVPESAAIVPEAVDYVVYFCGLDCYEKWKDQGDQPASIAKDKPR